MSNRHQEKGIVMSNKSDALAQLEAVLALSAKATQGECRAYVGPQRDNPLDDAMGVGLLDAGDIACCSVNNWRPYEERKANAELIAAAVNLIRDHAETLRALLGAADGVLPQLPKARELTNYAGNVPLPYYTADDMLRFAKATYTATLTKAPAND